MPAPPRCISASRRPPTAWPCFYGVDTPQREKLLAATMTEDEMRDHLGVDSACASSRSTGSTARWARRTGATTPQPQYCDACFSGEYPVEPVRHDRQGVRAEGRRIGAGLSGAGFGVRRDNPAGQIGGEGRGAGLCRARYQGPVCGSCFRAPLRLAAATSAHKRHSAPSWLSAVAARIAAIRCTAEKR